MLIDEELTLKKLEVFLAFMRSGNLSRAAAEVLAEDAPATVSRITQAMAGAAARAN